MTSERNNSPSNPSNKHTTDVLTRAFSGFFKEMLRPQPSWSRPTDEQFIEAIAESIVAVGNEVREGRGIAMLQTFVYDLQELIEAGVFAAPKVATRKQVVVRRVQVPVPQVTALPRGEQVKPWDVGAELNKESPLFRMGYSVAVGGPIAVVRRAILQRGFDLNVLPGVISNEDKRKWGPAKSAQRLYGISSFLAWLCSFQGGEKPAARKKWIEDLAWLKANCFRTTMQFAWPDEITLKQSSPGQRRTPIASFMKPLRPSIALAAIVGSNPQPRTEAVSKLWTYVKEHNLNDKVNERMINTDAKLKKIFGKSQISMFEMAGLIGKHLS